MYVNLKDSKNLPVKILFCHEEEFPMPELVWVENIFEISLDASETFDLSSNIARDGLENCILAVKKGCVCLQELQEKLYQGQSILLSLESDCRIKTNELPAQALLLVLRGELAKNIGDRLIARGATFCPNGLGDVEECRKAVCVSETEEELSTASYHLLMRLHEKNQSYVETKGLPILVETAIGIMREECGQVYGVSEVADRLGVSSEHLTRLFSKTVGISPGRFLRQQKLKYAKELLKQPDLTVALAAQLSGFSDANYFSRVFQKEVGVLPSLYRESHQREHVTDREIQEKIDAIYL